MLRAATAAASVRVTLDDGGQRRDVAVTVRDPGATLADLAAAVGWSADALRVDGHLRPVEMSLASAGLREGCVVALPAAEPTRPWAPAPALAVSGGLVAGPTLAVPARPAIVGRGEDADLRLASPTVSEAHAQVTLQADGSLQVTDLGSTNGTWRGDSALTGPTRLADGDELRLGAVRVRWCAADPDDAAVVPPVGAGDAAA
ncbi:MAG TPA: FHA domain-containing protein, partial [Egibacteraceae bacterium]